MNTSTINRVLAQGVCESICATTPNHRAPQKRNPLPAVIGWAVVACACLFALAFASTGA